jgi:Mn2+/Fe2+ NRAMP family transporter
MEDKFKKTVEMPAEVLEQSISGYHIIAKKIMKNRYMKRSQNYWQSLGPGLTTGASDDDPSGIATYSQTGAQYGFQLLWLSAFTFPLMSIVQEMCARIGVVTGKGLAANIRIFYPICSYLSSFCSEYI